MFHYRNDVDNELGSFMWRFLLLILWQTSGFAMIGEDDTRDNDFIISDAQGEIEPWHKAQLQKLLSDYGLIGLPLGVFSVALSVTCINFFFNNYYDTWTGKSYPDIETLCKNWLTGGTVFSLGLIGSWLLKKRILSFQD